MVTLINIGQLANDGTGDDLREAFYKVNQNFEDLDLRSPDALTVENLGTGANGLYAGQTGTTLEFKELVAGDGVTLTPDTTGITISNSGLLSLAVVASTGDPIQLTGADAIQVVGTGNVTTSTSGSTLTIDAITSLSNDPAPELGSTLNANNQNIQNADTVTANNFIGNFTGLVYNTDVRKVTKHADGFDFGPVSGPIDNFLDYLMATTDIDLGTINNPSAIDIDMGSI